VRIAELEARVVRAELVALRAQLHPHFLFNTMNAAVARLRTGDTQGAAEVLTNLCELLRHFLTGADAPEGTLKDEIVLVSHYLAIERARFPSRLLAEIDVPEPLQVARIPTLVVQPLVENAVRHGVARRETPVRVRVEAWRDQDSLIIRVRDDGPGLPAAWKPELARGIGLQNTRERIARLYGARGHLSVTSPLAGGVEAVVTLPFRV
jgi:LytS/YehU family sensor histidine kinase